MRSRLFLLVAVAALVASGWLYAGRRRDQRNRAAALRALTLAASLVAAAPAAWAQAPQCSTCEACTAALAAPNAQVELSGDLALRGAGPCVVIRGAGARLNGLGHVLLAQPGGGVGVRVEAADVNVRTWSRRVLAERSIEMPTARASTVSA